MDLDDFELAAFDLLEGGDKRTAAQDVLDDLESAAWGVWICTRGMPQLHHYQHHHHHEGHGLTRHINEAEQTKRINEADAQPCSP